MQCKDAITFPISVNLTSMVHPVDGVERARKFKATSSSSDVPEGQLLYNLTAILLHRGCSASSGHYVSIVKDERTGVWWKYDDDNITRMGGHPFKGARWDVASSEEPAAVELSDGASRRGAASKKPVAADGTGMKKTKGKNPGKAAAGVADAKADSRLVLMVDGDGLDGVQNATSKKQAVKKCRSVKRPTIARRVVEAATTIGERPPPAKKPRNDDRGNIRATTTAQHAANDPSEVMHVSNSLDAQVAPFALAAPAPPFEQPEAPEAPPLSVALPLKALDQRGDAVQQPGALNTDTDAVDTLGAVSEPASAKLPLELCSKDAYMLMYTRKGCEYSSCVPEDGEEHGLPVAARDRVHAMVSQQKQAVRELAERRQKLRVRLVRALMPKDFFLHYCMLPVRSRAPSSTVKPA